MTPTRTILFQRTKTGKVQQWSIWVVECGESGYPEVWIEHGQVDGAKQTTFDVIKEGVNEGKANATTPLQQAYLTMERKLTKQREHGYSDEQDCSDVSFDVDWTKPLPKELCYYKPVNSIDPEKLAKLEASGRAIYTIKRNGMCHITYQSDFGTDVYSRRMDVCTGNYPHLLPALKRLPPRTILLGEVILEVNGKDSLNLVSTICRSDPDEAIAKQAQLGNVKYYVYDVVFHNGKNLLTTMNYRDRRCVMLELVGTLNSRWIMPSEVVDKPHTEALKWVSKERGLEGLVVWDALGMIKDGSAYTFNGKAARPNVVFKSKPKYEDDFIARWCPSKGIGDYGKGKNKSRVGKVFLYQLLDGKEVFVSKCGGGLKDSERDFYTNELIWPRVWQIEYSSIQPGTGSLQHPEFKSDRTILGDKDVSECVMSKAIQEARQQEQEDDEE